MRSLLAFILLPAPPSCLSTRIILEAYLLVMTIVVSGQRIVFMPTHDTMKVILEYHFGFVWAISAFEYVGSRWREGDIHFVNLAWSRS